MATVVDLPAIECIGGVRQTAERLRGLTWQLVRGCAATLLLRLPLSVAACGGLCLLLSTVPTGLWHTASPDAWSQGGILLVLAVCYTAAGVVWGIHRALRRGWLNATVTLTEELPSAIDPLLAPLAERAAESGRQFEMETDQVRQYLSDAGRQLVQYVPGSTRWTGRWTMMLIHWALRSEKAIIERALRAIESRGETRLSASSLSSYARDALIAHIGRLGAAQLRQWDLAAAMIVFALLVLPTALVAWLGF